MFGREVIIGSPIYEEPQGSWTTQTAIQHCLSLNGDENPVRQASLDFSDRMTLIEPNRDVSRAVPEGGFYLMTAKEWEHVFADIMSHSKEIDFITDFLDGAERGCTYLTSDDGMSYSCVNGLMPTPSDAILRCAYLVPLP